MAGEKLSSVSNALDILHLLRVHESMKLSEIATELGVSNSTAHRLVSTLRDKRFVRQELDGKRYELGSAMLFAASVSALEHCVEVSKPVMRALGQKTNETVHMSVLRGRHCLFAASVESERPVRVTSRVGQGPDAHTAAGGKILLAALNPDQLAEIYAQEDLDAATGASITSFDDLSSELEQVRELGYARNLGESEVDMYALAVPVYRPSGETVSSLTIAVPLSRMQGVIKGDGLSEHEKTLLEDLRVSAKKIESMLSF